MRPALSAKNFIRIAALAFVVCSYAISAAAADPKWTKLLVSGKISDQWETKGNWQVERDGVVVLKPRPGEEGWRRFDAYLWCKQEFTDFEIQFEYKFEPEGNSGFYFRVGDKKNPVENGLEVQLMDIHGIPADSELNDHDAGGIIPGYPPTKRAAKPAREWNKMSVKVKGDELKVVLNDEVVNEMSLNQPLVKERPRQGFIGFQDHGMPLAVRKVRYRSL